MSDPFMQAAIEEARKGIAAGGIPIGSVLVHDQKIIGRGHDGGRLQGSVIHHAEMNCLENAGRLPGCYRYRECVFYSTLSPCPMCSGAVLLYGIPRVIVGENKTLRDRRNTSAASVSSQKSIAPGAALIEQLAETDPY